MKRTERIDAHSKGAAGSTSPQMASSSQSRLRCAVVALGLFVAASFSSTLAFGQDRKLDPPPPAPTPPMNFAGDETIGTLPIIQGPQAVELRRDLVIAQPSLCLEGELSTILNSIAFTRGDVVATIVSTDARSGRVRLVFPGNAQIAFDKLMIESSSIRVGLWTPGRTHSNLEAVWSDRRAMIGVGAAFSDLPILSMSAAGALSYSPLLLMAHGAGSWTSLLATTTQDFLIVRQAH